MTKQEVLNDIDALCKQCDQVSEDIVLARLKQDDAKAAHVHWRMESLIIACHEELSFLREYIAEGKPTCVFCGTELRWDSSINLASAGGDDDDEGIVSHYTCPHCGRSYEISDPTKEERENKYKEYYYG